MIDLVSALAVIFLWGINFVIIKVAISEVPPLLFGFLRYVAVVLPAIFFIKPPKVSWRLVVAYGVLLHFGQFALLFNGIDLGMPSGLTSLLLQVQAFFTVILAALVFKTPIKGYNLLAIAVALAGLALIQLNQSAGQAVPMMGLLLVLAAALSWSLGNLTIMQARHVDMVSLVVWGSLVAIPLFFISSWLVEGPALIHQSLSDISLGAVLAVLYQGYLATLTGYVLWGRLLSRHPVGLIAPLTLIVPVVGLITAAFVLDEQLSWLQWLGAGVVMSGLVINVLGHKLGHKLGRRGINA